MLNVETDSKATNSQISKSPQIVIPDAIRPNLAQRIAKGKPEPTRQIKNEKGLQAAVDAAKQHLEKAVYHYRMTAVHIFHAGERLFAIQQYISKNLPGTWSNWQTAHGLSRSTVNEAIRLYTRATTQWGDNAAEALEHLSPTDAKTQLGIYAPKALAAASDAPTLTPTPTPPVAEIVRDGNDGELVPDTTPPELVPDTPDREFVPPTDTAIPDAVDPCGVLRQVIETLRRLSGQQIDDRKAFRQLASEVISVANSLIEQ
jgi:hypothetical protein